MKNQEENKNEELSEATQKMLFEQVEVPFQTSKEDAWALLSKNMKAPIIPVTSKVTTIHSKNSILPFWLRLTAAAAILLVVCSTSFCKFYMLDIHSNRGQHLAHTLPDGSTIQINAESVVSYAPYWWYFNRSVQLEGEAFFEVETGSRFVVESKLGKTEVLGTSFNIYTRDDQYNVLCTTGKVKVTSKQSQQSLLLAPNEIATLIDLKRLEKTNTTETTNITGWKKDLFYFNTTPLMMVFKEIERQYNIQIDYQAISTKGYTFGGSFEKRQDVELVLKMVLIPFNLSFKKTQHNYYKIEPQ